MASGGENIQTARTIQMMSAMMSRIPTIVQIRPLFMGQPSA
jgi:hypothetical protein